jgi:tRNA (cytidine/uridine-2'-O-)-methyltransferase
MHVVLIEPEIPGNTGSIARTCAGTGTSLHLVGKLGFSLEDKYLKRAGLDYWSEVDIHRHPDFESVLKAVPNGTVWLFAKRAEKTLWDVSFGPDDLLVFGCETRGLPADIQETYSTQKLRIPITEGIRSLNLANAATVAIYEGLRQIGWSAPAHDL